jgi:hypothetical protein
LTIEIAVDPAVRPLKSIACPVLEVSAAPPVSAAVPVVRIVPALVMDTVPPTTALFRRITSSEEEMTAPAALTTERLRAAVLALPALSLMTRALLVPELPFVIVPVLVRENV